MLTEKYDFRITDQMTIPLRPHWIANDSYREKCKMLVFLQIFQRQRGAKITVVCESLSRHADLRTIAWTFL